jgi:hypothetical protein
MYKVLIDIIFWGFNSSSNLISLIIATSSLPASFSPPRESAVISTEILYSKLFIFLI